MTLDHGVVGNGSLLALVRQDSGIDWLCLPRFDSPSVFARLLDEERGGTWRFLCEGEAVEGTMRYVHNTNVLVTRFEHGDCAWDLFDFAPLLPEGLRQKAPRRLTRYVAPVKGTPRLTMEFEPKPDYARAEVRLVPGPVGLELEGAGEPLHLFSNVPAPFLATGQPFLLDRPRYFGLVYGHEPKRLYKDDVWRELDLTIAAWRQWAQSTALPGFHDEAVLRSALCLALHQYQETGAIIAATTTSVPETVGEPRTWDYRFCWLRDSVFTVEALRRLAHFQEGINFVYFMRDVAEGGPLQPLYGIGGERDLPEMELDHLAGYKGTKPVRVGNQAAEQAQHDLMGELVLCLRTLLMDPRVWLRNPSDWMPLVERMVDESIAASEKEDLGIWEYRGRPRLYTFSQAMCWAAVHHGAAIARHFDQQEQVQTWEREAERLKARFMERAYNEELGMFTQAFDDEYADASNLLLPSLGIVAPTDPKFLSTLERYREILVKDRGVMRYVHEDDFGTPKSTFTICSFWWVEALALAGHLDEAVATFEKLVAHSNPLGLLSEDIDAETGELCGNFPQAYTHVGLINAATTIGQLLRARESRFTAWS